MAEFFYLDLHIVDESNSLYEVFAHDHFYFQTEEIDLSASAHPIRRIQVTFWYLNETGIAKLISITIRK